MLYATLSPYDFIFYYWQVQVQIQIHILHISSQRGEEGLLGHNLKPIFILMELMLLRAPKALQRLYLTGQTLGDYPLILLTSVVSIVVII